MARPKKDKKEFMNTYHFRMNDNLLDKLKMMARYERRSLPNLIRSILERAVDHHSQR